MKQHLRLAAYMMIGLALLGVTLAPAAWAASSQRGLGQTVPPRTPTQPFVVTIAPTEAPATQPPGEQPPATTAPAATAVPGATEVAPPTSTSPAPAALLLVKEVDRTVVWPGLRITFSLVLTNRGASSVRNVVVEDVLPAGLIPGEVQGASAAWDGRTLRARTPVLPPGGRLVITFGALVQKDLAPGGIIVNQAAATATGSQRATAGIVLVLPPSELPPTGACTNDANPAP